MNKQEIEAFAFQYHGIHCIKRKNGFRYKPLDFFQHFNYEDIEHIELRSIDSLTDEEEDILSNILNGVGSVYFINAINNGYPNKWDVKNVLNVCDYLRSIGIAVPFRGYTVEQMIEQGILRLKGS